MGWKSWPYWLRGGLIGVIITVITGFLISMTSAYPLVGILYYLFTIPDLVIALPYRSIARFFVYDVFGLNIGFYVLIGSYIIGIIPNFIIGAIIGLIMGKIKNKKQENQMLAQPSPSE